MSMLDKNKLVIHSQCNQGYCLVISNKVRKILFTSTMSSRPKSIHSKRINNAIWKFSVPFSLPS